MWFLYIVKCSDDSLYTGIAVEVKERIKRHNLGKASKYTRSRRPVVLVYTEQFHTKSEALKREIQIKKLSRLEKQNLIKH